MTKRKFHQTVVQITILSEYPAEWDSLGDIAHEMLAGDWSGNVRETRHKILNGKQTAKALINQGSDPGFFQLMDNGEDAE